MFGNPEGFGWVPRSDYQGGGNPGGQGTGLLVGYPVGDWLASGWLPLESGTGESTWGVGTRGWVPLGWGGGTQVLCTQGCWLPRRGCSPGGLPTWCGSIPSGVAWVKVFLPEEGIPSWAKF